MCRNSWKISPRCKVLIRFQCKLNRLFKGLFLIVVRVPLRISLVGGGTDIPSIYKNIGGGCSVGFSIDRYMYISMHRFSEPFFRFKYSKVEDCDSSYLLEHDLARESFKIMKKELAGYECASLSDVPGGTGLGSSSAFTVGLLKLLSHFDSRQKLDNSTIAELASKVEIDLVGSPIGKQDQFLCALGGMNELRFEPSDIVVRRPVKVSESIETDLNRLGRLYRIGKPRSASAVLSGKNHNNDHSIRYERYKKAVACVNPMIDAINEGDYQTVGSLLNNAWKDKLDINPSPGNRNADKLLKKAIKAGAFGGKLLGAGDSGFIYVLANDHDAIEAAINSQSIPIKIDLEGAKIVLDDHNRTDS